MNIPWTVQLLLVCWYSICVYTMLVEREMHDSRSATTCLSSLEPNVIVICWGLVVIHRGDFSRVILHTFPDLGHKV